MAELRKREEAASKTQVWAPGKDNFSGGEIQHREIRINGSWVHVGGETTLFFRDATRSTDPISLMTYV